MVPFQYPPIGSRRCNASEVADLDAASQSFSTLQSGRDAATNAHHVKVEALLNFQYPPIGSRRCNATPGASEWRLILLSVPSNRVETLQRYNRVLVLEMVRLSVPSNRVETLQRPGGVPTTRAFISFSTLQSGRDAATLCQCGHLGQWRYAFSTLQSGRDAATLDC